MGNESCFTITPLCAGWLAMDKGQFLFGRGMGQKIDIPVLMFYLEDQNHRILVDTGCSDVDWALRHHYPTRRTPEEEPIAALASVGASPNDIDVVIQTHLHWDHCWNNHLFVNATFVVQREELRYAAAPLPVHFRSYETPVIGLTPRFRDTPYRVIEGDAEVVEGVQVLLLPGHTPGMQGVLVQTAQGRYLLAGDNVPLSENLAGDAQQEIVPGSNYVNLEDYYLSLRRMQQLVAKDRIIPGHDRAVLEHGAYGVE